MKTIFKTLGVLTLCAHSACVGFDEQLVEETVMGPSTPHELSGEVMLFVNARMSSANDGYQSHARFGTGEGRFVGNAMYLYDPSRTCEDGTSACRLVKLGHALHDEAMGLRSVEDGSLRRLQLQDVAWSPSLGLWGLTYDPKNDEWGISTLEVPQWGMSENLISMSRFAFWWGDPEAPDTDPCYWQEAISGLGFVGDDLVVGVRGIGGAGLDPTGAAFRVSTQTILDEGHCVNERDVSGDPEYYACGAICEPICEFGWRMGVAGDISANAAGDGLVAWVRAEDDNTMAIDRNALYGCTPPDSGAGAVAAQSLSVFLDDVQRGTEIEGTARIGEKLYGITTTGLVYEIDDVAQTLRLHDDLSGLFEPGSFKLRGATRVNLDAL